MALHPCLNDYRHFSYMYKLKNTSEIKLLSKIYNRDTRKENLSLVFATVDNQVFGYGRNDSGCLGVASVQTLCKTPAPIKPLCGKPLVKICTGNRFVIALTEDGKCYSWGDNKFGQLGHGKNVASINKPVFIDSLKKERVLDVCCGLFHVLVLTDHNDIFAFGSNVSGSVGNGTTFHQSKPVQLTNIAECNFLAPDIVSIATGGWHSACVNRKGELFLWGWNERGQCNLEDTKTNQVVPRRVLLDNFNENFPCTYSVIKSVQCGLHHTLALTFDGVVFAFGSNEVGECAQDVTTVKMCLQAELVYLEEPMIEICALAKSRLSLSRSKLHFYVWGQSSQTNVTQPHIPRKFTISQQIQSSLSFNTMLARNEQHQFNFDVNSRGLPFAPAVVIADSSATNPSKGALNFTFNDPNESDIVMLFGNPNAPPVKAIFVQKAVLDCYSNFLVEFSNQYSISTKLPPAIDNPTPSKEQRDDDNAEIKLEQVTLTIARNKQKFHQMLINDVPYETLYSYLFFIYSNFLVVGEDKLVSTMQLCQSMNNEQLLNSCLSHIERHFELEQLCHLYKCALQTKLTKVCDFCIERGQFYANDVSIMNQLHSNRQSGDFALTCTDSDGTLHRIPAHRLVLMVRSSLFPSLIALKKSNNSNIGHCLVQLNNISTIDELLAAGQIHFGALFTAQTLEMFVHTIYRQSELKEDELTIEMLVDFFKMNKVLGESSMEQLCIEHLKKRITLDNVCQLYVTYSPDCDNAFLVDLCMEMISQNWNAFLVSDQFRGLLATPKHLQMATGLIMAFSNHLLRQQNSL